MSDVFQTASFLSSDLCVPPRTAGMVFNGHKAFWRRLTKPTSPSIAKRLCGCLISYHSRLFIAFSSPAPPLYQVLGLVFSSITQKLKTEILSPLKMDQFIKMRAAIGRIPVVKVG